RGLQAVAELPFDALRERGEDADALRVEADADARLVMTADVVRLRFAGLVAGFPRLLAQLGLAVAFGAVRVPVVERRLAPVGLERLRVLRQLIVEHLLHLFFGCGLVAGLPQLVPLRGPVGLRDEKDDSEKVHGTRRRTTPGGGGQRLNRAPQTSLLVGQVPNVPGV